MIAAGHNTCPEIPHFSGLSEFRGQVLHSRNFKDFTGMEKKRVLVIGTGNSGLDIANELTHVTEKVQLQ